MLKLLTKYLLQYKTVTIPKVGTIQVVANPSTLSVADKMIEPPFVEVQIKNKEEITGHQLNFLMLTLNKSHHEVLQELKIFGDAFYDKINGPGFEWKGFGKFERSTQSFKIFSEGLDTIPAERVMRENPDHKVLVGDRETSSYQIADTKAGNEVKGKPQPILITIGWILLVLSVLAIAFFIYQGKFNVNASGSKQSLGLNTR